MNKVHIIFILILFSTSCRTTYDKDLAIRNNIEKFKSDSIKKINERDRYIDSIFNYVSSKENINLFTHFINSFPNSKKRINAELERRKLFFDVNKVIESNLNVDSLIEVNACYAPIYKKIDYVKKRRFNKSELINLDLDSTNPYKNRFVVADLNSLNKKGKSRGVKEIHFNEKNSWEFKNIFAYANQEKISIDSILDIEFDSVQISEKTNKNKLINEQKIYRNYFEKVKKYKEPEVEKAYSIFQGRKYNVGQNLCFCEIIGDTIYLQAKHITSSQGQTRKFERDSLTNELILDERGKRISIYSNRFPLNEFRGYYAPVNKLSSRNWDRERKYDESDAFRDSLLGGGKSTVALFDSVVPLPNFITLFPDKKKYRRAVSKNGIHEGSLNLMSRCMLGTPQSLGCFRMNDYGSKFARWWIPNHTNFFVYYEESRYSGEQIDSTKALVPFRSPKEGNIFREWIHKYYPKYAKEIDLDISGSCNNCYVYLAWQKYGLEFINSREGKTFRKRKMEISKREAGNKKAKKETENKTIKEKYFKEKDEHKIIKKFEIVINCLEDQKKVDRYIKKIKKKNYTPISIKDGKSNCYLIKIGSFNNEKEAKSYLREIKEKVNKDAWIYISVK